ncbi:MAG: type II toxin-antitoxin system RelE/ParE family toxin [Chloroflexota bacterium]|nr:type II toxin-antitoxin system RelE/ParE family toxin [Chloroflexota bacterium]
MRIHVSQAALIVLRNPDTPTEVRQAVASLAINPRPPDALSVIGKPGDYEFFESGFWIVCEIQLDNLEEVVRVLTVQPN